MEILYLNIRRALSFTLCFIFAVFVRADEIEFDTQALISQGLDVSLASRFTRSDTFPPGKNNVTLQVNGENRGHVVVNIGENGQLCPDTQFMRRAGLKISSRVLQAVSDNQEKNCIDLRDEWPQFTVRSNPGDSLVEVFVPQDALEQADEDGRWDEGGSAGLINYDLRYLGRQVPGSQTQTFNLDTRTGFNAGGWVVRSNQSLFHSDGNTITDVRNTNVQRTFTSLKSTLQAGQISLSGGLFAVGQVTGFQFTPESALYSSTGAVVVTGIADSPSDIVISQLGVPVYNTSVPEGPFSLSGFTLLNSQTDLTVSVTGTDGNQRSFTVAASAYARGGAVIIPGLTWGLGLAKQNNASQSYPVALVSKGFQLTGRTALQSGALWAHEHQAVGLAVNTTTFLRTDLSLQSVLARSRYSKQYGTLSSLAVSQPFGDDFSLNMNASHQSTGYREASERDDDNRNKNQYGGGVTWSNELLGSFSLSAGRSTSTNGGRSDWRQLGWSQRFGQVTLNVSASSSYSRHDTGRDDRLYVSLQLPLNQQTRMSSTLNQSRDGMRYGSRIDQRLSLASSWSLAVSRDDKGRENSATGSFSTATRWSNLSASLSTDSSDRRTLSTQASGSVVLHKGGLAVAPYQIDDTFGIARVGNKAGVRLDTPSGPVWTNEKGYAVIPSISGWSKTTVGVDTRSLGKHTDVINGSEEMMLARGAVSYVNFDTVSSRRVMVDVRDTEGRALPSGMAVYDPHGTFITIVDEDSRMFLSDASPGMTVSLNSDSAECQVTLDNLPAAPPKDAAFYETITGVCRP
ncbi:fimbria/pilus outer membrane usher protein [Serratia fonticola]|uniref:fimbria/pilus outer membrane usher protein n=1 Tax=Serratia fonticola TaxID=47917 RepID=UPI0024DEA42F|nr:fimbria/pilus outer membrane usher protein [Serratia fonticola]